MNAYGHILSYVASTPWAILDSKAAEIQAFLVFAANGGTLSTEQIQARIGTPPAEPPAASRAGSIAVLPLRGTIANRMGTLQESSGGMSCERFSQMYRQAMQDPNVTAVVVDVDSPGGAVPGCHELATEMLALRGRKPTVAVANDLMASAAFWIGGCVDEVVAVPSARIGSIGVFSMAADLSEKLKKEGVKVTLFKFGANKAEGEPFAPMSAAAVARRQAAVDEAGNTFVADVARARRINSAEVRTRFGDGAVLSAKEALRTGMIDRIATLDDTLERLAAPGRSIHGRRSWSSSRPAGAVATLSANDRDRDRDRGFRL